MERCLLLVPILPQQPLDLFVRTGRPDQILVPRPDGDDFRSRWPLRVGNTLRTVSANRRCEWRRRNWRSGRWVSWTDRPCVGGRVELDLDSEEADLPHVLAEPVED